MVYIALILDDKKMFNEILSERHFIPNMLILQRSMNYSYIIKKDCRKKNLRNNFDKYKDVTDYYQNTKILSIKL